MGAQSARCRGRAGSGRQLRPAKIKRSDHRRQPRFTLGQRLVLAVVPRVVWALLWIVGLTWRFEVIAEEGVEPVGMGQKPGREIYCFWHQCVLPCTMFLSQLARGDPDQPEL